MAETTWLLPSTVVSFQADEFEPVLGGTVWSNPNNAKLEDDVATTSLAGGPLVGAPEVLKCTNYNFSQGLSTEVTQITVRVRMKSTSGIVDINARVNILKEGEVIGSQVSNGSTEITSSYADYDYNVTASDIINNMTYSNFNSSLFGVYVDPVGGGFSDTIHVDSVKIKLTYNDYSSSILLTGEGDSDGEVYLEWSS